MANGFQQTFLEYVPADAVTLPLWTSHDRLSDESVREIAQSISEVGLLQPIVVVRRRDTYLLVFGARRLYAMKRLGWQMIPVLVRVGDDNQAAQAALVENIQRAPYSTFFTALKISESMAGSGTDHNKLSRAVGKPPDWVSYHQWYLQLGQDVQMMLHAAPDTHWCAFKINAIPDPRWRFRLITAAMNHMLTEDNLNCDWHHFANARAFDAGTSIDIAPHDDDASMNPQAAEEDLAADLDTPFMDFPELDVTLPVPYPTAMDAPSPLPWLLSSIVNESREYSAPESLDARADLISLICRTVSHLTYMFFATPSMTKSDEMIQEAVRNAPFVPMEWEDNSD